MSMRGIDVSYANGSIDWSKAKNEIDFAIIRSSFGSDLPSQTDSYFFQNTSGCEKNNIPYGIYHFAYFVDEDTARKEADFAIRLAKECKNVKFIALDVEEDSERYAKQIGKSPNWTACCLAFMNRIKSAGYLPVFYSNQSWLTTKLNYEKIRQYKLWYAAPGASQPKYTCSVWQYSWKGKISGITGDVDMDCCYEDELFKTSQAKNKGPEISQLYSSSPVDKYVTVQPLIGVNIRSGAGTSYDILGAVPCGEKLHVERETGGGNYSWGLIKYNGIHGWVALDYTKEEPAKISKGDKVKLELGAKIYGSEKTLGEWIYNAKFTVMDISDNSDRVTVGLNGSEVAAVYKKDLKKQQ